MKVSDFFLERKPLFSTNNKIRERSLANSSVNKLDFILEMKSNSEFIEALFVSSHSLYDAINQLSINSSQKQIEKIYYSMISYLNRMSFRPIPFGYSASVAIRKDKKRHPTFQKIKKVNATLDWLFGVAQKIENDELNLEFLKYTFNNNYFIRGDIIYYFFDNNKRISLKITPEIRYLLKQLSGRYVTYGEILNEWPFNKEQLTAWIATLISYGVVKSSLTDLSNSYNQLKELITQLSNCEDAKKHFADIIHELDIIDSLIFDYGRQCVGDGLSLLKAIETKMSNLFQSNNYLAIAFQNLTECEISNVEQADALACGEYLVSLAKSLSFSDPLDEYTNKFIEKYGLERSVPILELLSEKDGIGVPNSYMQSEDVITTQSTSLFYRNKILGRKLSDDGYVHLSDDDIAIKNRLTSDQRFSYDIGFDFIDHFIVFAPSTVTSCSGSAYGRFSRLFDLSHDFWNGDPQMDNLFNLFEAEDSGEVLELQNNFSMVKHSLSDVSHRRQNRLAMNDIFITYDLKKHCLISVDKYNNPTYAIQTNLLIPQRHSFASRLLMDISPYINNDLMKLSKIFSNKTQEHQPGIKYHNVIIMPERWNFVLDHVSIDKIDKLVDVVGKDKTVKVYFGDSFIVCNTSNKDFLFYLIQSSIGKDRVVTVELVDWNPSEVQKITQGIWSIRGKDTFKQEVQGNTNVIGNYISDESSILELPLKSNWIYIKLHTSMNEENEVIKRVFSFSSKLNNNVFLFVIFRTILKLELEQNSTLIWIKYVLLDQF
ncbi:lantibiotic dehydratase [Lapidilactobacillus bayanensis]|uniref:lantibiotic dehydratase n=1 Tax=Lapidilactobacillus bayanensis TaxID=2485998 RepID=UPI000F7693B8|nr:lantibiotic dehydratase [Lapidilactobacillus bayanensis]